MTPKEAYEYLATSGAHFKSDENWHVITCGCEGAGAKFYDVAAIWNRHVNSAVANGLRGNAILAKAGVN